MASKVKRKLDLSEISIISMNCIGGVVYHDCEQLFLSPTINLYFMASHFIKFINRLDYYCSLTPVIKMGDSFPIGTLDDINIFFMHYGSCEEALEKWEERKKRINYDKIFVIMVEQNGFDEHDFECFKELKYPKILFTKTSLFDCKEAVYYPEFRSKKELPDLISGRHMYNHMKLVDMINRAYG